MNSTLSSIFIENSIEPVQLSLKSFKSMDQLESFILSKIELASRYFFPLGLGGFDILTCQVAEKSTFNLNVPSYSKTNVQVEGIGEADIVKTDGEYLYFVRGRNEICIVKAYPPEEANVKSTFTLNGTVIGLYVYGDLLIVIGQETLFILFQRETNSNKNVIEWRTYIKIFDVQDKANPKIWRDISLKGWYINSRMIDNYLYLVASTPAILPLRTDGEKFKVVTPEIYVDNALQPIRPNEIYYSNISDIFTQYTIVMALNVADENSFPNFKAILTGPASCIYMSYENLYVSMSNWSENGTVTVIHKIRIHGDEIHPAASGKVPGRVLNQFSMDEYKGFFRIATTTGHVARSLAEATSSNHIYILNSNLEMVGKIENLASGERIYAARFMGARCYLVTFRKVDPLFVIDLSNPEKPKLLGRLKIPGFSDYIHPYDDSHIIGIGKETVEAEEGDFAWYQGVKIALFDVSNPENPKLLAKYIIGDRGTDSPILRDHHALLFSKEKNLLAMPILLAKIDPNKYPSGVPPYVQGEYVWQGLYVFNINGTAITFRGRITHLKDRGDIMKSGCCFNSQYAVKRAIYIGNVLYTISDRLVKANDLQTLREITTVIIAN